jgi:hypothetical protein
LAGNFEAVREDPNHWYTQRLVQKHDRRGRLPGKGEIVRLLASLASTGLRYSSSGHDYGYEMPDWLLEEDFALNGT